MADSKIPPTFKSLLPFVRRADELERDSTRPESKLIAYYCRQYAMELGIKLRENDSSDEATNYLLSLMDRLEEDKAKLPTFSQDEGKEICEDFAIEIFTKADDEDRAGCADKNTARTFYAAGTFFDILNQFGDVSEDMMEKRRYCKYKAATILKAIKEGTTPTPGPPGAGYATGDGYSELASSQASAPPSQQTSMPNLSSLSLNNIPAAPSTMPVPSPTPSSASAPAAFPSFTSSASSFGPSGGDPNSWNGTSAPSAPSPPPAYTPPPHPAQSYAPPPAQMFTPPQAQNYANPPPPQQPAYTPQVPVAPPSPHQQPAYTPQVPLAPPPAPAPTPYTPQTVPARNSANAVTQNEINDAMECAKFAVAALKAKDIELAIQRLEMALKCIK